MKIWYLVDFKPLYQLFSSLDINLKYYSPLLAILTGRKPSVLLVFFCKNPHLSICTLGKTNSYCILSFKTRTQKVSATIYYTSQLQQRLKDRQLCTETGQMLLSLASSKKKSNGRAYYPGTAEVNSSPYPSPPQCLALLTWETPAPLPPALLTMTAKQISLFLSLSLIFCKWSNIDQVIYAMWM